VGYPARRIVGSRPLQAVIPLLLLFLSGSPAFAAPIPPLGKSAIRFGITLPEVLINVAATMLLLRSYHLKIYRMAGAYLVVAMTVAKLLFPVILPAFDGNMVLGNLCQIFLETAALFMLTNLEWFRSENTKNLLLRTIFMAVLIGNVAMILSLPAILPVQLGLLRYFTHLH